MKKRELHRQTNKQTTKTSRHTNRERETVFNEVNWYIETISSAFSLNPSVKAVKDEVEHDIDIGLTVVHVSDWLKGFMVCVCGRGFG